MFYRYDTNSEITMKAEIPFEGMNCHHGENFDLENFRMVIEAVADDGLILSIAKLPRSAFTIYQNGQRQLVSVRQSTEQQITALELHSTVSEQRYTAATLHTAAIEGG